MIECTSVFDIQEHDWECVVIGAGPAGAMAARTAARRGLRTLIVDRKTFPREKVCGACVNRRALSLLKQVGLGHVIHACQGISLDSFLLRCGGYDLSLRLPGGVAVSRATLDSALVAEAVAAGAVFVGATTGTILPPSIGSSQSANGTDRFVETRRVRLVQTRSDSAQPDCWLVRAPIVIAADGLGHPSLKGLPEFQEKVAGASRIGIGAVLEPQAIEMAPGTIGMVVGQGGYVGMVHIDGDRLNVAACLDVSILREKGNPGVAVADILRSAGFGKLDVADHMWKGTVPLTRSTNKVASQGVFVVGDAAGYIEPFTGEGIAWALAGGVAVGDCAVSAVNLNRLAAEKMWIQQWGNLIMRRQILCRCLSSLLRYPSAVSIAVRAASTVPQLAQIIVTSLNSSAPDPQVRPL